MAPTSPSTEAPLRILYGVNGEGMGHATRSEVVIGSLLERHDVRVVTSGAAFRHLAQRLPRVDEVFGPTFALTDGEIRRWATVKQNLSLARHELSHTIKTWVDEVDDWKPEVVISDFEPLSGLYARLSRVPLIVVGNINMLDRCRHDAEIVGREHEDFMLARAVAHAMVPGGVEYIVTTFFEPPLRHRATTLVPPIVRPEIVAAKSASGDHLVVYSSGDDALLEALRSLDQRCLVYGMRGGPGEPVIEGNLEFRPRSTDGFVEALRTARGVVTGGGFSLLSEAIYLRKPVLSIPLRGQFEQLMNARYLERLGYGICATEASADRVSAFVSRLDEFDASLRGYHQSGNSVALDAIQARALEAAESVPRELRHARRVARRAIR